MRRYLLSCVIASACLISIGSARAEGPTALPTPSPVRLIESRRIGPAAVPAVHHENVRAAQGSLLQVSLEQPVEWLQRSARKSAEVPAPDFYTRPPVEAMRPDKLTILKSRQAPALTPVPSIQSSLPLRETLPPVTKTEPALQSAETLGEDLDRTSEAPTPPLPPQTVATLPDDEKPATEDQGKLTITRTPPRRNLATRPPVQPLPAIEPTVQTLTTRQLIMLREVRQAQHRDARIQFKRAVGYNSERPSHPPVGPFVDVNAGLYWHWRWHPVLQLPVYGY